MGPAIKPLVPEKQKAADQLSAVHQKIRETLAFQRYAHLARVECRHQEPTTNWTIIYGVQV